MTSRKPSSAPADATPSKPSRRAAAKPSPRAAADASPAAARDPRHVDREAELKRQADVVKAVDRAHREELPKLGGPS